ncbi:MAG TPA: DnaB-like helicase C-terminal domain-containing protein [Egibacteraceae bacterium]|nr:DnaB-like helicase C-terminal domain-containing protein [Egibacteraceae bacterium]
MLQKLHDGTGGRRVRPLMPFPTGFEPLDSVLNGGLRAHDLTLLGGAPAVGKTIAALQWARSMAQHGATVVYVCYEHDESDLLARLLLLEIGSLPERPGAAIPSDRLHRAVLAAANGHHNLRDVVGDPEVISAAQERLAGYASRLRLVRASASRTTLDDIEAMVLSLGEGNTAVVVDYLQKIRPGHDFVSEGDRITAATEGLKEMALTHDAAVLAVVAADITLHQQGRIRLRHLRGAGALGYESDVVVMLNDKMDAVSKAHLAYDGRVAEAARDYVVFSIEKNRGGPADLHLEHRKDFRHFRFEPDGRYVAERVTDDRLVTE